jgi:hypothetical protein
MQTKQKQEGKQNDLLAAGVAVARAGDSLQ